MTPNECAELFAKTLEELNAVSQLQMQGILNVVIAGLEAGKSLTTPGNEDAVQKLSALIDDLKSALDKAGRVSAEHPSSPAENSDNFCAEVEANINLAMKNSVMFQQQLNTIAAAALAQVIEHLIALQKQ